MQFGGGGTIPRHDHNGVFVTTFCVGAAVQRVWWWRPSSASSPGERSTDDRDDDNGRDDNDDGKTACGAIHLGTSDTTIQGGLA